MKLRILGALALIGCGGGLEVGTTSRGQDSGWQTMPGRSCQYRAVATCAVDYSYNGAPDNRTQWSCYCDHGHATGGSHRHTLYHNFLEGVQCPVGGAFWMDCVADCGDSTPSSCDSNNGTCSGGGHGGGGGDPGDPGPHPLTNDD